MDNVRPQESLRFVEFSIAEIQEILLGVRPVSIPWNANAGKAKGKRRGLGRDKKHSRACPTLVSSQSLVVLKYCLVDYVRKERKNHRTPFAFHSLFLVLGLFNNWLIFHPQKTKRPSQVSYPSFCFFISIFLVP